jgi:Lanthionine synthetase C-like protein
MHLFDEKRHERLVDDPWDAAAAANAIRDVAADALAASRNGLWPAHPLDDMPNDGATLYTGAAGMLWGLSHLASVGAIEADERIGAWAGELPARYRAAPDTGSRVPSYLLGETGVLLTALRARPCAEWFDDLLAAVNSNIENPTLEALWGAPGTMLAAVFAADLNADERWRAAYAANVAALARTWLPHEGDTCDLWMQDLYGKRQKYLGPAHGFAGNVYGMLRRPDWLTSTARASIQARAIHALHATAVVDGDCANWPPAAGRFDKMLVQWCHGAPGMVTAFGTLPRDDVLDELLTKGGELTWRAGPLTKGPSLCHGTAGNGAAFLTLFARTGDSTWLERARRFAMHSIRQVAAARALYGRGRYSLWTGDVGVVTHLRQCIAGTSGLPSLDF